MDKTNKLQVKDLINIGIFTAIYFVAMFIVAATIGMIPVLYLFLPTVIAVVCGVIYMMFMTKVKKKGMILIMSTIIGLLMFFTGHMWTTLFSCIFLGIIAEVFTSIGKYKSTKFTIMGYCAFSCWPVGAFLPIWFYRDIYFKHMETSAGQAYANAIKEITPPWILIVIIIAAIIGGLIGGIIGKKILKKHFIKAGIV
ncbi:MptD family putative ECF transporter S component [Clostridium sporogenes]